MKRTTLLVLATTFMAAACGSGEVGSAGPVTTAADGNTGSTTPTTTIPIVSQPYGEDGSSPNTTITLVTVGDPETPHVFTAVYFIGEGQRAEVVTRSVDSSAVVANTLRALLEGPSATERAAGLSTAVPPDTLLLGLEIDGGLATIDLSREFEGGGGSTSILSRLGQVVYTVTQFPEVDEVRFRLDGEDVTVFSGEGVVLEDPVSPADYETILPVADGSIEDDLQAWEQEDLPSIEGVDAEMRGRVVLVEQSGSLAVRQSPEPGAPLRGTLAPGSVVIRTGLTEVVGSATWAQIETPGGPGWVDERFLGSDVSDEDFQGDERIIDLLNDLAATFERRGNLRPLISERGLYLVFNAAAILYEPADLETILSDPTTFDWPSDGVDMAPASFAERIGDSFVATFAGEGGGIERNPWLNLEDPGIPPEANPVPFELRGFNTVAVHGTLPGGAVEDPTAWVNWHVSIDFEDGEPRVVGLTYDAWSP